MVWILTNFRSQNWDHIIHLLHGGYYNLDMFCDFSASVQHMQLTLFFILLQVMKGKMKQNHSQEIIPNIEKSIA